MDKEEDVLKEIEIKRTLPLIIRTRRLKFLEYITIREDFECLTFTCNMRRKIRFNFLTEWVRIFVIYRDVDIKDKKIINLVRDVILSRAKITYV